MPSIKSLVGKKVVPEIMEKLTPDELHELEQANYNLRKFGFGPYTAVLSDASGNRLQLAFSGFNERAVQASALAVRRLIGLAGQMRRHPTTLQDLLDDPTFGPRADQELGRLRNYRVYPALLGNLDEFLSFDPRTIRIEMFNKRGQVIYRA